MIQQHLAKDLLSLDNVSSCWSRVPISRHSQASINSILAIYAYGLSPKYLLRDKAGGLAQPGVCYHPARYTLSMVPGQLMHPFQKFPSVLQCLPWASEHSIWPPCWGIRLWLSCVCNIQVAKSSTPSSPSPDITGGRDTTGSTKKLMCPKQTEAQQPRYPAASTVYARKMLLLQ